METNIAKYQRVAFVYAKEQGFDKCIFAMEWRGYMAFHVSRKAVALASAVFAAAALFVACSMRIG